jgi:transcriptional regulator with XRE-family HTH domain
MPTNFWKSQREKLNKTQREIAIALNVTDRTVGNWENFDTHPSLSMVANLARVYEVPAGRIEQAIVATARAKLASAQA